MPKIAVSGGTGYVGRFIVDRLLEANFDVVLLGRTAPDLNVFEKDVEFRCVSLTRTSGLPNLFDDCTEFVHAAFYHEAGKYRDGEGNNPATFRRANLDGSVALFSAAKAAGVQRTVFLSSRAVYGPQSQGTKLFEDLAPKPDTLYGEVKLLAERALLELSDADFLPIIVRSTGVYGRSAGSPAHKWSELFTSFESGEAIPSRVGTEVHGEDLAEAICLLLCGNLSEIEAAGGEAGPIFNVSDILLDRRELLAEYARMCGIEDAKLPAKADVSSFSAMDCAKLRSLAWKPRGTLDLSFVEP